jgi:hypothetical protein
MENNKGIMKYRGRKIFVLRDGNYLHCLHRARRILPGIWQLLSSITLCDTKFRNVDGVDCIYENCDRL